MTFGLKDEHRHIWPVRTICAVLGVSVSGYYAWRRRPESRRSVENRALLDDIRCAHAESGGCYGAPRVHAALRAAGRQIGRHRVARLMRLAGLRGLAAIPRRVRTTDSRHDYPIAPNRLRGNFTATTPNQVWLADLTYIRTGEGWLFLAALIDMHTRVRHGSRTDGDHMAHRGLEHARDPSCLDRTRSPRHGRQTPAPGAGVRHRSRTHGDAMAHSSIRIAAFNTRPTSIAKPLPQRR